MRGVKEYPILFSGPMIRAILEGRKTQTRRLAVLPPFERKYDGLTFDIPGGGFCSHPSPPNEVPKGYTPKPWFHFNDWYTNGLISRLWSGWDRPTRKQAERLGENLMRRSYGCRHSMEEICLLCPYGRIADRLWVRETWGLANVCPDGDSVCNKDWVMIGYQASKGHPRLEVSAPIPRPKEEVEKYYTEILTEMKKAGVSGDCESYRVCKWRSPLHMPRWASRLTLEVTKIKLERLQDITEEDAEAEGAKTPGAPYWSKQDGALDIPMSTHRYAFSVLWNSINGHRASWADNPWVWVVSFKRTEVHP